MDPAVAMDVVRSEVEGKILTWIRVGGFLGLLVGVAIMMVPVGAIFIAFDGPIHHTRSLNDYLQERSEARGPAILILLAASVGAVVGTWLGKKAGGRAARLYAPLWAVASARRLGVEPDQARTVVAAAFVDAKQDDRESDPGGLRR